MIEVICLKSLYNIIYVNLQLKEKLIKCENLIAPLRDTVKQHDSSLTNIQNEIKTKANSNELKNYVLKKHYQGKETK